MKSGTKNLAAHTCSVKKTLQNLKKDLDQKTLSNLIDRFYPKSIRLYVCIGLFNLVIALVQFFYAYLHFIHNEYTQIWFSIFLGCINIGAGYLQIITIRRIKQRE